MKTFNDYLEMAEQSKSYGFLKKFAEDNKIKYSTEINRYNDLETIFFYGNVKDFYSDMKRSGFVQETFPDGRKNKLQEDGKQLNIEVHIKTDPNNDPYSVFRTEYRINWNK